MRRCLRGLIRVDQYIFVHDRTLEKRTLETSFKEELHEIVGVVVEDNINDYMKGTANPQLLQSS